MNKESTNLVERVRFGTFELNVRTGELASIGTEPVEPDSAKVLLREQPFRILRILVERQGQMVTRQEIRQILWPNDTFVDYERSINVAMAILRKALADDADHPKYIETLARRGYRLIAPVEWHRIRQPLRTHLDRSPKHYPGSKPRWVSENREHQNIGGKLRSWLPVL
jgi:DNA-binding winged helix-turn-helix (wHTH) protein